MKIQMKFIAAWTVLLLPCLLQAQPGWLDQGFGQNGTVTTQVGNSNEGIHGIVIQPDGKIVVCGYSDAFNQQAFNFDFALARYMPDGSLDTSFGNGGKVITDFGTINDFAFELALLPDGRIVAAGYTSNDMAVALYHSDGTLDNGFSGDGKTTFDFAGGLDGAFGVVVQPDYKIIIGGDAFTGSNTDFALIRMDTTGTPDNTFGINGRVTTAVSSILDACASLALDQNGNIVAAGRTGAGVGIDIAVVRYLPDGTPDSTFNGNGIVTTPVLTAENRAAAVVIQPDGKIVVTGRAEIGQSFSFMYSTVRYNINGSLDNTFNGTGIVTTQIGNTTDSPNAIALQQDGKLLVIGKTFNGNDNDFGLIRYTTGGLPDNTFGMNGVLTTAMSAGHEDALAIAVQPDAKIVAAGRTTNGTDDDFALARYFPMFSTDLSGTTVAEPAPDIYPNPATNKITVTWNAETRPLSITLMDVQGKILKSEQWQSKMKAVDFTTDVFEPGVYYLRLETAHGSTTRKIILVR